MISLLRLPRVCRWPMLGFRPSTNLSGNTRAFCDKSLDVNTNVSKDVILYKYDNPRYFKILNIFALTQFVFWTYLSVFSFTTLRDAPVEESQKDLSWWRKINLGENKYKNTMAIVAFFIGYGILTVSWMYTLKSVRYLILLQGGQNLGVVTYTPMGTNRIFTVSLKNVSCQESRSVATSQMPLKIKNHYLYYLIDMKGEFRNPTLFDHTAGLKRKFRSV